MIDWFLNQTELKMVKESLFYRYEFSLIRHNSLMKTTLIQDQRKSLLVTPWMTAIDRSTTTLARNISIKLLVVGYYFNVLLAEWVCRRSHLSLLIPILSLSVFPFRLNLRAGKALVASMEYQVSMSSGNRLPLIGCPEYSGLFPMPKKYR